MSTPVLSQISQNSSHRRQTSVRVRVMAPWERTAGDRSHHVVDLRRALPPSSPPVPPTVGERIGQSFIVAKKNSLRWKERGAAFIHSVRTMISERRESGRKAEDSFEEVQIPRVAFIVSMRREMTVFLGIVLVMLFSLSLGNGMNTVQAQKVQLIQSGRAALEKLLSTGGALGAGRWDEALVELQSANAAFAALEREFTTPSSLLLRVVGLLPIRTRWSEGSDIATVGRLLTGAGEEIGAMVQGFVASKNAGETLRLAALHARGAHERLGEAKKRLGRSRAGAAVPLIAEFSEVLDAASDRMGVFSEVFGTLEVALGGNQLKRYLIVFENSDEIRPAGGFMGSFALIDVVAGSIVAEEFPKGGSYDLKGSLGLAIVPPRPLAVFHKQWQFQDVNWFSHWPTSAETIKEFYEASGGPTVDGVIAITSPVLERVLEITGPVMVNGETVDRSNVIATVQRKVELEYDRKLNAPKQYIADLAAQLQAKISSMPPEQLLRFVQLFDAAIAEKLVLAWAVSPELHDRFRRLGVAGEVVATDGDYLQVVLANIGGQKTDRVITSEYNLVTTVQEDGRMENRLRVTRTHTGKPGELFYGVKNTTYARIYVPNGSRLIKADGFARQSRALKEPASPAIAFSPDVEEYDDRSIPHPRWNVVETKEYGKTAFGGWWELHAGAREEIELVYELPMRLASDEAHTLLVQKQPGGISAQFQYQMILPESIVSTRALPEASTNLANPRQILYNTVALSRDQWYGVITRFSSNIP